MQLTINLPSGNERASQFAESVGREKLSSWSYHESNLSLIARKTMRLPVNHQLIPIPIQSKIIYLKQIYNYNIYKISKYCRNFTVLSPLFDVKKQRPKTNFQRCYQCSVNSENSLDLKVCFPLVTCKINNLIALRSTNQVAEISPPWWLKF